jgi:hypothetical protein
MLHYLQQLAASANALAQRQTSAMPTMATPEISLVVLDCLQRVSQEAPGDVPAAAILELDTAAHDLVAYFLRKCSRQHPDHTVMVPEGA